MTGQVLMIRNVPSLKTEHVCEVSNKHTQSIFTIEYKAEKCTVMTPFAQVRFVWFQVKHVQIVIFRVVKITKKLIYFTCSFVIMGLFHWSFSLGFFSRSNRFLFYWKKCK